MGKLKEFLKKLNSGEIEFEGIVKTTEPVKLHGVNDPKLNAKYNEIKAKIDKLQEEKRNLQKNQIEKEEISDLVEESADLENEDIIDL